MSKDDIVKIKERLSIEEVVGSYINLQKAGKNYKARCPFHNEKTPSFVISPERKNYYCFGCGANGDIFSFVQEFEGLEFKTVLKNLADRAGIILSNESFKEKSETDLLKKILEEATVFFEGNLGKNLEAQKYLQSRGLTKESVKDWRIGFVGEGWDNLYSFLTKKGFSGQNLEKVGLIKKGDSGKYYDRFRSRIIFPIFNSSGEPVAFTGRVFGNQDDKTAKYLNSPETVLFSKSHILHGFDRAKNNIRKFDFTILVEGQVDLIMAHQVGYKNTVASSGTALTRDQLELVNRISENLVIAYDSDGAGFRASKKAWQMALALGMNVKIAQIPQDEDPADIILRDPEIWKEVVKNSKHIIEISIDAIQNESDPRKKSKLILDELVPYLGNMANSIEQSYFINLIHSKLNVSEKSIEKELEKFSAKIKIGEDHQIENATVSDLVSENNFKFDGDQKSKRSENLKSQSKVEEQLFGILFWQQSVKEPVIKIQEFEGEIKHVLGATRFSEIENLLISHKNELIFNTEKMYDNKTKHIKEEMVKNITDLLTNLKLKSLNQERERQKQKLNQAEIENKNIEAEKILQKIDEISKKINKLS